MATDTVECVIWIEAILGYSFIVRRTLRTVTKGANGKAVDTRNDGRQGENIIG